MLTYMDPTNHKIFKMRANTYAYVKNILGRQYTLRSEH